MKVTVLHLPEHKPPRVRKLKNTDFHIGETVEADLTDAEGGTGWVLGRIVGRTSRDLHVEFGRPSGSTFRMALPPSKVRRPYR